MQKGKEAFQEGSPSIPYILNSSHGEAIHQGVVRGAGKVAGADGGETTYQGIAPAPSLC